MKVLYISYRRCTDPRTDSYPDRLSASATKRVGKYTTVYPAIKKKCYSGDRVKTNIFFEIEYKKSDGSTAHSCGCTKDENLLRNIFDEWMEIGNGELFFRPCSEHNEVK